MVNHEAMKPRAAAAGPDEDETMAACMRLLLLVDGSDLLESTETW